LGRVGQVGRVGGAGGAGGRAEWGALTQPPGPPNPLSLPERAWVACSFYSFYLCKSKVLYSMKKIVAHVTLATQTAKPRQKA
jgi:hypothetical protein